MKQKSNLSQIILSLVGIVVGLISIQGGIAAFKHGGELWRFFISAVVMIGSGVLWLICSLFPKFYLTRQQYTIIGVVLLLGLSFGLFHTFSVCGGECGFGAGFCHLQLGYPGRWLRISNCMAGAMGTPGWLWLLKGSWSIDPISFIADLVFWSGAGLIISVRNKTA